MFNVVRDYQHGAQYVKDKTGTQQQVKVFTCTVGRQVYLNFFIYSHMFMSEMCLA